jgi:signal transduction histidine kinase
MGAENARKHLMNEFASSFMDEVNVGIVLMDVFGLIVNISRMACEIFEIDQNEVIGVPVEKAFRSFYGERFELFQCLRSDRVIQDFPFSWSNGQHNYELMIDSNQLVNRFGQKVGSYLLIKDVTPMRTLESQIRNSDRLALIGQIAAGAAHEIRNPLTSIKGFLQLIKMRLQHPDFTRELKYSEIMLDELERINHLVGEFLMLSKPKQQANKRVLLSTVMEEIMPVIEVEANLHDICLISNLEIANVIVNVDREQLKQVILNIAKNGIEAMKNQGKQLTIRLRLNPHENTVTIEIHDQGPGIPAFMIDKIFDPFYTTKEHGTGLGLPICKRIINDLGGQIRISSKGFGTTMNIVLPIACA